MRNLDVKDRGLEIDKGQAGLPHTQQPRRAEGEAPGRGRYRGWESIIRAHWLHSSWCFWLDRRDSDLWCCNHNKGLSWAVRDGCRTISKNPLLQECQGRGQGFERGDSRFHKKSVKDRLYYHPSLLEGYTSCRLIPLDKNPGIRPTGVGEVLRRIVGKNVSGFLKEEIKETADPFQVCAGHSADSETVIHAMSQVFVEEGTDGILLIDAGNAFNQMNRSVALHNIRITCKEMSLYIINTYRSPSRLFIADVYDVYSDVYSLNFSFFSFCFVLFHLFIYWYLPPQGRRSTPL